MSVFGVVLLAFLPWTRVEASPAFQEAWYYEVMLGDLGTALERYRMIFRDPSSSLVLRRRAALRAGRCAEKLGNRGVARSNYEYVIEHHAHTSPDAAARLAAARLKSFESDSEGRSGDDASIVSMKRQLQKRLETRLAAQERVARALREQRERSRSASRIEDRLLERGIDFLWEAEWTLDSQPSLARESQSGLQGVAPAVDRATSALAFLLALPLEDEDTALLRSQLAHRFYVRSIRALEVLDLSSAVDFLRLHAQVAVNPRTEALDLTKYLETILRAAEGLRAQAHNRFQEELGRRRSEVFFALKRVGDRELGSEILLEAKRQEDWSPTEDGRLREFSNLVAQSQDSLLRTESYDALQVLQGECQLASRRLTVAVESLLRNRFQSRKPSLRLVDPESVLPRLRRYVEDVLAEAESRRKLDKRLQTVVQDVKTLCEWIPELDESGAYGSAVQRALQR